MAIYKYYLIASSTRISIKTFLETHIQYSVTVYFVFVCQRGFVLTLIHSFLPKNIF